MAIDHHHQRIWLQEHPWVTCNGRDPLPSTEMNVTNVEEVTEDDIAKAIGVPSVSYIVNAVRAATRWRRFAARRTQSDSAHSDGSTASTDMSRNASHDVMEALHGRRDSDSKEIPSSPSRKQSSDKGEENMQEKEYVATLGDRVVNNEALKAVQAKSIGTKDKQAEREKRGSASSQSTTSSRPGSPGIKPAMSFPQSFQGGKEKRLDLVCPDRKSSSMVEFPEVDRHLSQQEYLSSTGIDDSSVETVSGIFMMHRRILGKAHFDLCPLAKLRHYEDTTGHMLPRSAVEDIVKARNASPIPRDRQTAKGPNPP